MKKSHNIPLKAAIMLLQCMFFPDPPIFVNLPPPEIYVNLSQAFNLSCVTDGNPTPNITWLKDGVEFGNRQNLVFLGSQVQFQSKFEEI